MAGGGLGTAAVRKAAATAEEQGSDTLVSSSRSAAASAAAKANGRPQGFFDDAEMFAALQRRVIPRIVSTTPAGAPVRVWVPECGTGEDAYSIAILLVEQLSEWHEAARVQVFATDTNSADLRNARSGIYGKSCLAGVRAERRRFFTEVESGYEVAPGVRDLCVFASHQLGQDPPFSKLDLILYRNATQAGMEKRVLESFHYALKPGRYLALNRADLAADEATLFAAEESAQKIFVRQAAVPQPASLGDGVLPANERMAEPEQAEAFPAMREQIAAAGRDWVAIDELTTSKEELQVVNRELTLVNEQLALKNAELSHLAGDLTDLLLGMEIPVVTLDHELRIRRFTPAAGRALRLVSGHIGRPIQELRSWFHIEDWSELAAAAMEQLRPVEREVRDDEGRWYTLRVRAYKGVDHRVGILIALLDIDEMWRRLDENREARRRAESAARQTETALRASEEQLRELTARLFTAQEEERQRIARELHDNFNQRMALLANEVVTLEKGLSSGAGRRVEGQLRLLRTNVNALSDDLRRAAYRLHPPALEHLGLTAALESLCSEFSKAYPIRLRFTNRSLSSTLRGLTALCLYRVAQECLTNITKHSGASEAKVSIERHRDRIRLLISDNGKGYEPKGESTGLGLIGIRERVRAVGGTVSIETGPGRGTQVDVQVPLSRMQS